MPFTLNKICKCIGGVRGCECGGEQFWKNVVEFWGLVEVRDQHVDQLLINLLTRRRQINMLINC